MELIGRRVILREFMMDDVDAMYAFLSDDEVFRHISWDQPRRLREPHLDATTYSP